MVTSKKMLQTTKLAKGPCPMGGCYVTVMEATIRYPDKKEANVDTGAWLHHIALFGSGAGSGSIWAAGNERPTLRLNTEDKYGLDFPTAFMLMIDLMTEDTKPKNLTLEINYEWVPKSTAGYKGAAMYWLTIGEPAAKNGVYKFSTQSQSSKYNGKLLYAIGHMHDGGTDMRLYINSKLVCKSVMHYNARAGYTPERRLAIRDGPGHHMAGVHISDPGKENTVFSLLLPSFSRDESAVFADTRNRRCVYRLRRSQDGRPDERRGLVRRQQAPAHGAQRRPTSPHGQHACLHRPAIKLNALSLSLLPVVAVDTICVFYFFYHLIVPSMFSLSLSPLI
jgi:hypothetical protein